MGNNKLFKITVKGVKTGKFARNASPGVTYVVAKSIDKAYNAVLLNYGKDGNLGNKSDFELDTIQLVASEGSPNECDSDTYKLITDEALEEIMSHYQIKVDLDNLNKDKDNMEIDDETLANNINQIAQELEDEGYDLDTLDEEDLDETEDDED